MILNSITERTFVSTEKIYFDRYKKKHCVITKIEQPHPYIQMVTVTYLDSDYQITNETLTGMGSDLFMDGNSDGFAYARRLHDLRATYFKNKVAFSNLDVI